jgi:RNA polymerase-interacting CarD/CdnL/TRCF family regulator
MNSLKFRAPHKQSNPRHERREGESMDPRSPRDSALDQQSVSNQGEENAVFNPGAQVMYGLHGKCQVVSVESKSVGGQSTEFYRLEVLKPALSRSTRPEPAIWIPVAKARASGLRALTSAGEAEAVLSILNSREYYFPLSEPWPSVLPQLERGIRTEGAIGLAKAYSFLYVLRKRSVVPAPEANRLFESVSKLLMRELAEATGLAPRLIEEKIAKGLRQKLSADN